METDEWRVTSEIDHLVDFLQELTVILERVPPSPVLEDALKQTLCTVTLFKNYFKYTKANIASGGDLAGETQATIDPFGDADGDKAYLPVLRLSRIQHSWMRGFYEKEYASEGAGLDKATMIDDMLEQLEYSARTLQQAVGMVILDVTSKTGQGKAVATTPWDKMNQAAENAEEQKRQAAQATHDVELKEKAHQIVKRVSEDRKEILTAVFGASTRFNGDDPCFPADAPVQKDRVGNADPRPNADCSDSKGKRVQVHAPNDFDYAASDGSALVSAEEPCTADSCLYKPDIGPTRAGSVLVDETFAMVESTVKQCDDLSEELKKALGSSGDECTLGKVQVALDAWWGNVKTMGCGEEQPCLFDGALDLHLLSKLPITNTEDLIKLPLWTGFLGLPSTMKRVAQGAGKYMLKKLWPFAPEKYEDAHEYLISVEADECRDASGRWLTWCIGPNKVEPVEAVPHQVIATYTLSSPNLAKAIETINSKLAKVKERFGKVMKAGKDKVDYEDLEVEVTDYEPGIGVNLLVKINVDDEAAAATAHSKLPTSVPIEHLWGGVPSLRGLATISGKRVEPPISDPYKYSDHFKKAQAKADKAWKPVPEARYKEGECKYLADKAIEVLWEKVREQQRRLDPSANSLLSPTAPSPPPSLPQVKQRRCDPLREYLDEIPPKSAAAVGKGIADDLFNTPVDKPETVKDEELTNEVKANPGPGSVDQKPLKNVASQVKDIEDNKV